jgi:hypothetical protein
MIWSSMEVRNMKRTKVVPRLLGELRPSNHLIRRSGRRRDEDTELDVVAVIADANSVISPADRRRRS